MKEIKLTENHKSRILNFMNNVNDEGLEYVYTKSKEQLVLRGKIDKSNNAILNFTSNKIHSTEEQSGSMSEMFDRAWIHGY